MELNTLTTDQLHQLAKDIFEEKVFTSAHIPVNDVLDEVQVGVVFAPIAHMSEEERKELKKDLGLIYEYVDKAVGETEKGYPRFDTMSVLTVADMLKLFDEMDHIMKEVEGFGEGAPA